MAGNSNSGAHLRGEKHPGSGRVRGTKNYKTMIMEELLSHSVWAEKYDNNSLITPALFWFDLINDSTQDISLRNDAAKALAPYLYRKQPTITETKITTEENVEGFSISLIPPKKHDTNKSE